MTFKTLAEVLEIAPRDVKGVVKYPLDCGCKSEHEHNMCAEHQQERLQDRRRSMGIADLRFTHRDFTDLPSLVQTLHAIKLQLISNPTKSCIIKVNPNETHASGASQPDADQVPSPGVAEA